MVANEIDGIMAILRYVAAMVFLVMSLLLVLKIENTLGNDSRLTRPGMWAGFIAGVVVILGNPKAILYGSFAGVF